MAICTLLVNITDKSLLDTDDNLNLGSAPIVTEWDRGTLRV
jgi:hypothetical protein